VPGSAEGQLPSWAAKVPLDDWNLNVKARGYVLSYDEIICKRVVLAMLVFVQTRDITC
jgi:hypothetical protein